MRFRYILLLLALCLVAGNVPVIAQSTTVSVTVVDQGGQVWKNGTISYVFAPNPSFSGTYQWNGAALPSQYLTPQVVLLNNSGAGSFTVPISSLITPAGSTWKYVVCPNASSFCTVINLAATGSTQNISSQVTSATPSISIQSGPMPLAYTDAEITITPNQGGIYFNVTSFLPKYFDGANWQFYGGGPGGGVTLINGVSGAFTFTGSGVSCVTTTCTFTGGSGGVTSFNTRTGAVVLLASDVEGILNASPYNLSTAGCTDYGGSSGRGINIGSTTTNGVFTCQQFWSINNVTGLLNGYTTGGGTPEVSISAITGNETLLGTLTALHVTISGITGSTQCLQVNSSGVVAGTGSACGAGGSGITQLTGAVLAGPGSGSVAATIAGLSSQYLLPSSTGTGGLAASNIFTDASGDNLTDLLGKLSFKFIWANPNGLTPTYDTTENMFIGNNVYQWSEFEILNTACGTASTLPGSNIILTTGQAENLLIFGHQSPCGNSSIPAPDTSYIMQTGAVHQQYGTAFATITNVSLTSNVVTITAANSYTPGMYVQLAGLTTAPFLNFQPGTPILSAWSIEFTFAFTHANVSSSSETGTAEIVTDNVIRIFNEQSGQIGLGSGAADVISIRTGLGTTGIFFPGIGTSGFAYLDATTGQARLTEATTAQTTITINSTSCVLGGSCTISGGGSGTVTSISTTGPITGGTITTTGTIACATCVTSAAALSGNSLVLGSNLQATKVNAGFTTDGAGTIFLGVSGTTSGGLALANGTSGFITIIPPPTGALGSSLATLPINIGTIAELNLAQSWSALQTFSSGINLSGTTSPLQVAGSAGISTQCLISGGAGVTPSWGSCGGGTVLWSGLGNPTANLSLTMAAFTTTMTYGATTGSAVNMFNITDTASNTGTGVIFRAGTATGSNAIPAQFFQRGANLLLVGGASGSTASVFTGTLAVNKAGNINGDGLEVQGGIYVTSGMSTFQSSVSATTGFQLSLYNSNQTSGTGAGIQFSGQNTGFSPAQIANIAGVMTAGAGASFLTGDLVFSVANGGAPVEGARLVSTGFFKYTSIGTYTNCSSTASPAVCTSSPSGSVVIAAASTTVVVNTTAITANSQIQITFDSSLGTRLGVTCNTTPSQPSVSARTAGTSFTITTATPAVNPACFSYTIIN